MKRTQAIKTRLKLLFTKAGANVTEDIMPDLLSFSYTDKENNEADEIDITLKDEKGKWAGTWKPKGGEIVRASITEGLITRTGRTLDCGKFYVDDLSCAGSPRTFTLKAVSIPLNKPIRKKIKDRAWEKKSLKEIASEIAKENEMRLVWDCEEDQTYDRIEQKRESDLKFISAQCEELGFSLKVTDDSIVIFDQSRYEKMKPVKTFTLGESDILSWNFESNQSETYKSCTVSFRDYRLKQKDAAAGFSLNENLTKDESGTNKAVWNYTYTDPEADENGQEYGYKTRVKSLAEAKRKARAKLRQLNLRSLTGSLTIIGDVGMVSGVVIKCKGFGSFDGNFIVGEATHGYTTGGYVTSLNLRRVNNKY